MSLAFWSEGKITTWRFADIKANTFLIGDCGLGYGSDGVWPTRSYFWYQGRHRGPEIRSNNKTRAQDFLDKSGPWPYVTWIRPTPTLELPVNFYGHSGRKTNMTFIDAHVEARIKLPIHLFELD